MKIIVGVKTGGSQVGGAPYPPGRTLLPRGLLVVSPTLAPSLLVCFRSKKDHHEGFIPFGFCLVFLFYEILK